MGHWVRCGTSGDTGRHVLGPDNARYVHGPGLHDVNHGADLLSHCTNPGLRSHLVLADRTDVTGNERDNAPVRTIALHNDGHGARDDSDRSLVLRDSVPFLRSRPDHSSSHLPWHRTVLTQPNVNLELVCTTREPFRAKIINLSLRWAELPPALPNYVIIK